MFEYFFVAIGFFLFGFILAFLGWADTRPDVVGTLKIDTSDPVKDLYRLEIDDFEKLSVGRTVALRIERNVKLREENSFYNE